MYTKVRILDDIKRAVPVRCAKNFWLAGTEFFVHQDEPGNGMVVQFGPNAGLGIRANDAEVIEVYESQKAAYNAMRQEQRQ